MRSPLGDRAINSCTTFAAGDNTSRFCVFMKIMFQRVANSPSLQMRALYQFALIVMH